MEPLSIRSLLVRVGSLTLLVKIATAVFAFGLNILLTRILGPQQYGDYVFSLVLISVLALFGTLGMDGACLRFVSGYVGLEAWPLLRGFFQRGVQWVLVASFSITLLFATSTILFKGMFRPDLFGILIVGLALVPISSMLAFVGPFLQALGSRYIVLAQSVQLLRVILLVALIFGVMVFDYRSLRSITIIGLNLLAATLVLIIFIAVLYQKIPWQVKKVPPMFENHQWQAVMIPFLLMAGLGLIITQTDTIMVGMFLGTEQAGFYSIAFRIASLVTFGIASANAIIAPMISQYYSQQRLHELQHIVSVSAKGIFIFSLLVVSFLFIFGKEILGLFGSEFKVVYLTLVILLVAQLIDSLAGSVGYLMTMTGHQREVLYISAGCAFLNIILNFLLIPIFGLPGAAIAATMSIVLWNIVLVRLVRLKLKLNCAAFSFKGHKHNEET